MQICCKGGRVNLEQSVIKKKKWMEMIPESEFQIYNKSGFRGDLAFGKNPALVVIDVTVAFTGSKPQPLEEAIKEFPTACGDAAWEVLPQIKNLLELFRTQE